MGRNTPSPKIICGYLFSLRGSELKQTCQKREQMEDERKRKEHFKSIVIAHTANKFII